MGYLALVVLTVTGMELPFFALSLPLFVAEGHGDE